MTNAKRPGSPATALAAILAMFPVAAHAQHVPTWLVAAVLSPILVFALCVVLGFASRSVRVGVLHAGFVFVWIVLFWLASYFVENDYVIWTPLALYVLHAVLLLVLIALRIARRIAGPERSAG